MIYAFEDYCLDVARQELRCRSEVVPVEPRVFDLLLHLIRNREHVVSKDQLIATVWNGRIVSESALSSGITAARHAVGDSGEQQRLIRTVARKGFRFVGDIKEQSAPDEAVDTKSGSLPNHDRKNGKPPADGVVNMISALALPDKPSIAVLPFQNMSGDPEQEYFADGVVEDITAALSRMRWLFVIARNSSFTYKGRAVDVKQVGAELGVRYVLQGGVRKANNRIRIAGQLIDASNGAHLWAERFDGTIEDIFDLQDQMSASIVGSIAPKLEQAEIERAKRKPTESLDAYDCFLRGMSAFYQRTKEANAEALRLYYKAIDLDPGYSAAYGMAAWCHCWRKMNGWMIDRTQEVREGVRLARRAVELGKGDAVALARGGHALAFLGHDLDTGLTFVDRALLLNPNLAAAWFLSGWLRAFRGEPEIAIEHHATAIRLSPLDPTLYHMQIGTAFAHVLLGRFELASSWAKKAFCDEPDYLPAAAITAVCCALAGQTQDALEAMRRIRQIDPALRISNLKDWYPIRRAEDFDRWVDGLRKAGLPE
jgi:TolB-like protein